MSTTATTWLRTHPVRHTSRLTWSGMSLPIVAGTVRFADAELPTITAGITIPSVPANREFLRRIDPREGTQVDITAGYHFPDGTREDHDLGTLTVRAADEDITGGSLTLEACSADGLFLGEPVREAGGSYDRRGVPALVRDILSRIMPTTRLLTTIADTYRPDVLDVLDVNPGEDAAALLETITQAAGLRLYSVGADLVLVHRTTSPSVYAPLDLSTGPNGNITSLHRRVDLSAWASRVEITAPNPANPEGNLTGVYGDDSILPATTWVERRDKPTSLANLTAQARVIFEKRRRLGAGWIVTAPAHYWLRPERTVRITDPTDTVESLLVRNVDYDLGAGLMTLSTQADVPALTEGA